MKKKIKKGCESESSLKLEFERFNGIMWKKISSKHSLTRLVYKDCFGPNNKKIPNLQKWDEMAFNDKPLVYILPHS